MIIFESAKFTLHSDQLIFAVFSIFAALVLIYLSRNLLKRKSLRKIFGPRHLKTMMNFSFALFAFFGIYGAFESLGLNFGNFLNKTILSTPKVKIFIYHVVVLYVIIVGTKILIYITEASVNRRVHNNALEKGKAKNIYQILKYFIYTIAIAFFVESLGFNITILIASLSALLIGLGLGIQHIFNDMVSGFIILFDRSVKIGDIVEIDGNLIGEVTKINLRTSQIITRDDVEVIIPNSKFTSENVTNWTHNSIRTRFNIQIGVAYGSDVRLVEKLLIDAAKENDLVCTEPEPMVHFIDFGDSALIFKLLFYSENNFRIEKLKSDLRFSIDKRFRENNIKIPFPQRELHINESRQTI